MSDKIAVPAGNVAGNAVETLAGAPNLAGAVHDVSMWGMFMQADLVVKSVIILLILSSFWCWKIIFEKLTTYRTIAKGTRDFERYVWTCDSLESFYEELKNDAHSPIERVFVSGMYEWESAMESKKRPPMTQEKDGQFSLIVDDNNKPLAIGINNRVIAVMENTRNREVAKLEENLGFLATVGSAAPFIGLFGTVWGIMRSFQAIAVSQNTSLAVVAPGIAEALFATAIGLFAAIPAVIFYNRFANQSSELAFRIDSFIDEFGSVLARESDD